MIIVSRCCAGAECRYHCGGGLKTSVKKLLDRHDAILVCPEQMGGLPTPREGCSVVNDRVVGRQTGQDYTDAYWAGACATLELCVQNDVEKAYLLKGSPSCGKGYGLTAKLLEENGIKVITL